MTIEIIEAFLKAALPLGALAYLMFRWSLKAGRLEGAADRKEFKDGMKAMKKNRKAKSRNPLHNKWMKFGGGFYGLVGLWTFLVIEALEIYDFANGYEGVDGLVDTLSTSSFPGLAIDFFINSIKNFVQAIAWPGYWPDVLQSQNILIWLIAAYGGYWVGMKFARKQSNLNTNIQD